MCAVEDHDIAALAATPFAELKSELDIPAPKLRAIKAAAEKYMQGNSPSVAAPSQERTPVQLACTKAGVRAQQKAMFDRGDKQPSHPP